MKNSARILAFAGSTRQGSYNRMALAVAAAGARAAGAVVTELDLAAHALPLFNADLEERDGLPAAALALKEQFATHNALLIASPEYNGSFTPLLKNVIDWVSRPAPGESSLASFDGKVVALVSASPGSLGGLRGLAQLRTVLGGLRTIVLPQQVAVPSAHNVFDEGGTPSDDKRAAALAGVGAALAHATARLAP